MKNGAPGRISVPQSRPLMPTHVLRALGIANSIKPPHFRKGFDDGGDTSSSGGWDSMSDAQVDSATDAEYTAELNGGGSGSTPYGASKFDPNAAQKAANAEAGNNSYGNVYGGNFTSQAAADHSQDNTEDAQFAASGYAGSGGSGGATSAPSNPFGGLSTGSSSANPFGSLHSDNAVSPNSAGSFTASGPASTDTSAFGTLGTGDRLGFGLDSGAMGSTGLGVLGGSALASAPTPAAASPFGGLDTGAKFNDQLAFGQNNGFASPEATGSYSSQPNSFGAPHNAYGDLSGSNGPSLATLSGTGFAGSQVTGDAGDYGQPANAFGDLSGARSAPSAMARGNSFASPETTGSYASNPGSFAAADAGNTGFASPLNTGSYATTAFDSPSAADAARQAQNEAEFQHAVDFGRAYAGGTNPFGDMSGASAAMQVASNPYGELRSSNGQFAASGPASGYAGLGSIDGGQQFTADGSATGANLGVLGGNAVAGEPATGNTLNWAAMPSSAASPYGAPRQVADRNPFGDLSGANRGALATLDGTNFAGSQVTGDAGDYGQRAIDPADYSQAGNLWTAAPQQSWDPTSTPGATGIALARSPYRSADAALADATTNGYRSARDDTYSAPAYDTSLFSDPTYAPSAYDAGNLPAPASYARVTAGPSEGYRYHSDVSNGYGPFGDPANTSTYGAVAMQPYDRPGPGIGDFPSSAFTDPALSSTAPQVSQYGSVDPALMQLAPAGSWGLPTIGMTARDRDLAIRTAYGEDANNPAAIAAVLRNRVEQAREGTNFGQYGDSIAAQASAYAQFNGSPTDKVYGGRARSLDPNSADYARIGRAVDGIMSGSAADPTNGATSFYGPGVPTPSWARGNYQTIGSQRFYGGGTDVASARPSSFVNPDGSTYEMAQPSYQVDPATSPVMQRQLAPAQVADTQAPPGNKLSWTEVGPGGQSAPASVAPAAPQYAGRSPYGGPVAYTSTGQPVQTDSQGYSIGGDGRRLYAAGTPTPATAPTQYAGNPYGDLSGAPLDGTGPIAPSYMRAPAVTAPKTASTDPTFAPSTDAPAVQPQSYYTNPIGGLSETADGQARFLVPNGLGYGNYVGMPMNAGRGGVEASQTVNLGPGGDYGQLADPNGYAGTSAYGPTIGAWGGIDQPTNLLEDSGGSLTRAFRQPGISYADQPDLNWSGEPQTAAPGDTSPVSPSYMPAAPGVTPKVATNDPTYTPNTWTPTPGPPTDSPDGPATAATPATVAPDAPVNPMGNAVKKAANYAFNMIPVAGLINAGADYFSNGKYSVGNLFSNPGTYAGAAGSSPQGLHTDTANGYYAQQPYDHTVHGGYTSTGANAAATPAAYVAQDPNALATLAYQTALRNLPGSGQFTPSGAPIGTIDGVPLLAPDVTPAFYFNPRTGRYEA